jgi:hypothetical protein
MNTNVLNPSEVIDLMIDLRFQSAALKHKINTLKPAFFAAYTQYNTIQVKHDVRVSFAELHAAIFRKLTPGKWNYPHHILEQEQQLKNLKLEFQKTHEPISGRDITWSVRLLIDQP